jgi:glycyl-tRNA synthetase
MEMQYFVKPGTDMEWFEKWKETRLKHYEVLGFKKTALRFKEHGPKELAHYARAAFDVQYEFPFGWQELEGIHNRGDFDLSQHAKFSGKKLEYFDEAAKEKFVPYVIETAVGCDRLALALLCNAYDEEKLAGKPPTDGGEAESDVRIVLRLKPFLAPVQVACLPLSKKPDLQETANRIRDDLSEDFRADYDESASIGKRYRRQDEIGTPLCLTVDFDTLTDKKVTVRHRDSMTQDRVEMSRLKEFIQEKLKNF